MDFQLKTLDAAGASREKCDALVVVIAEGFKPSRDALSRLAADAIKAGDLDTKAGKLLQAYQPSGTAAKRAIFVGAGDGSPRRVHAAICAAVNALRSSPNVKRIVISLGQDADDDVVRAAVTAVAEASYVYVT